MTDTDMLARLAAHRALGGAPKSEHEWLVAHGTIRTLVPGELLTRGGELASTLAVFLTGHVAIHIDRGAGSHKIFEWRGGDVGGMLPFSRGARAPSDAIAEEPTEILTIPVPDLAEMIRECPSVTATLVHIMLDRARQFNASDLRDEKLISLGKLAAGLAHELNNPASAAVRSAKLLTESLHAADTAATAIGAARLSDEQLSAIERVRGMCAGGMRASGGYTLTPQGRASGAYTLSPQGRATGAYTLSPLGRADREEMFAEWLVRHGANESCAAPLAETRVTLDALDALAAVVHGPALGAALQWVSAGCTVAVLASDIETATRRIHDLVNSVKGFTFMDRAPTREPVDIRDGIDDTFTMLASKTRAKNADVTIDLDEQLPRALAVGAELNQVWMNLIDNALDAIPVGGHLSVTARAERGHVVVRITDDGPGIPAAIAGRIFDPFFTTKDVGKGTGLGLDIVRRILRRNEGEVEVDSRPGHTQFCVTLPAEQ